MKSPVIGCKPTFNHNGLRITGDKLVRDDYFLRPVFLNAGLDTTLI